LGETAQNTNPFASFISFQQKQDPGSFTLLYQQWGYLVYAVALKYLKNKDEAKDAVTDIFEKLWVEIPKSKVENWKSWLYAVTKFHCLMALRSKKAIYKNLRTDPWQTDDSMEELEPWLSAIDDAVEVLKEDQKKCVTLFYWEGLSYEKIATQHGYSLNEVKSHIQNGKRKMRIWIEQKNGSFK
jgi:RNA polymerase sigma factor (sigma-70 family)